jgi:hypothetical protein
VLSVLSALLKFAAVVGLCYAFLIVSKLLGLFSFAGRPIPDTVISLIFSVMLLMSVISCTVGLTKSMYYARDNAVLLTLPCPSLHVYLSKLIIFFIFEVNEPSSTDSFWIFVVVTYAIMPAVNVAYY